MKTRIYCRRPRGVAPLMSVAMALWLMLAPTAPALADVGADDDQTPRWVSADPADAVHVDEAEPSGDDSLTVPQDAYHAHARSTIAQVLEDDEFANLNPSDDQWLREKFEQVLDFFRRVNTGFEQMPVWVHKVIVGWMIITLLAILLHLVYTLWQSMRKDVGTQHGPRDKLAQSLEPGLLGIRELDHDVVLARARELLQTGAFEQAMRYLYAAAILYLDRHGRLRFAPAKTNRDYLQELPLGDPAQSPLRSMTRAFEAVVFGRRAVDEHAARAMAEDLDAIHRHEPPHPTAPASRPTGVTSSPARPAQPPHDTPQEPRP